MSRFVSSLVGLTLAVFSVPGLASAASYYVDPVNGNIDNPGSASQPWSTLEDVFESGKNIAGGDVIYLRSGRHGTVTISGQNESAVTIRAEEGQKPILSRIIFDGASHWVLEGVDVTNELAPPEPPVLEHPVYPKAENFLVRIIGDSSHIVIRNSRIYSIDDSSAWTADDWNYKAWNGIGIRGANRHITIEDTTVRNINFAIDIGGSGGEYMTVRNCIIQNYCGDGLRPNASNSVFENNRILDVYNTNGNHIDAIQGFKGHRNVVIRGNTIIDATSERPLMGACQGIGLFDGWYEDWTIENNIVAIGHWHGITLMGARGCKVVNNTVVRNPVNVGNGTPWIRIVAHKNKEPSTGNIVRNNLASSFSNAPGIGPVDHNIATTDYDAHFVNYEGHDFRLKPTSSAINAGNAEDAPSIDFEGQPRDNHPDVGADEQG